MVTDSGKNRPYSIIPSVMYLLLPLVIVDLPELTAMPVTSFRRGKMKQIHHLWPRITHYVALSL